ncbi:MAG: hypothetical protein JW953_06410 [Anaerolineae bacterium]|nr:hypothetical protein [Anaerolineae bacterium]
MCQRIKNASDLHLLLTPVILMSGRTLDSDIRYAKSLGADDYLPKPLNVDDLLAVVQGKLLAAERLQNLFIRKRVLCLTPTTIRDNDCGGSTL